MQVGLRASSGTLATSPLSFVRPVLRRLVGRSTVAVPNFALQNVDRLIFLPPLSKMEPHAAIGDEREREDRVARDRKLAEIASKYVVRKMFGFFFNPLPPCTQLDLIYTIKFAEPPLLCPLFQDSLLLPMRTSYLEAPRANISQGRAKLMVGDFALNFLPLN